LPLDADDIAELYRDHARDMVAFFARRVLDPEVAVDLTAETFAAALADGGAHRGQSTGEAVGWLYGIARHQLAGWYRRGEVEQRALARLGGERRALTDDELERIEDLAALSAMRERLALRLGALPDDIRAAVELRVIHERSYADVAAALSIAEPAARARVSRGLRALAAELDADGGAAEARHA
jgi:RNA polymerase sigma factor (sigma-70 family)